MELQVAKKVLSNLQTKIEFKIQSLSHIHKLHYICVTPAKSTIKQNSAKHFPENIYQLTKNRPKISEWQTGKSFARMMMRTTPGTS